MSFNRNGIKKIIKRISEIICLFIGLFFLLGTVVTIKDDIVLSIFFGMIALIFLFFSKNIFLDYVSKIKLDKIERENRFKQKAFEKNMQIKQKQLEHEYELKKMELEQERKIKQLQIENQQEISLNNELEIINSLSDGYAFEEYTAELLKKLDYINVSVTSSSNDYGIDVLAEKDSIKYAIQCKYYSQPVGNKAIQEAYSGKAFYNCHIAVVLTNNTFTENAINLSKSNGVLLWDGNILQEMIKKASVKN